MPLAFKKGDAVRQVVHVIEGVVVGQQIVDDEVQFCVEYLDAKGDAQQRYFKETEISAIEGNT